MPRRAARRRTRRRSSRLGTTVGELALSVRTAAWLGRHLGRQGRNEVRWLVGRARQRLH